MARTLILAVGLLAFSTLLMSSESAFQLEQPEYTVLHTASEFEIRKYTETVWAVAEVDDISFARATTLGFHRLFEYIQGANLNWTRIDMTAPVWTGIVPSAGPFHSSAFEVRLYLPEEFQKAPPTPIPELDLKIERIPKQTLAVRQFSGYALDNNIAQQAEKLASSLSKSDFVQNATFPVPGTDSYGIAQYSSPFQLWNRHNEVWVGISIPGHDTS